ncbi:MAG: hypothetical protein IJ144_00430 [Prevotella sp.]|nr:hypothetical protein [Prevotella sp.]MBQ9186272.1 hypothetical protein [Prevotella sp.]
MKKTYVNPAMLVVAIQGATILAGSITEVNSGDTGIGYIPGGSSQPGRGRRYNADDFEDELEDEEEEEF